VNNTVITADNNDARKPPTISYMCSLATSQEKENLANDVLIYYICT